MHTRKLIVLLALVVLIAAPASARKRRGVRSPGPVGVPVALADAYAMQSGDTLIVAGSLGVLANDSDPEGRALTAVLVSTPALGTLTLNSDGGFTYAHTSPSSGTDQFTYKATNGLVESGPVTVTITVAAPEFDFEVTTPNGQFAFQFSGLSGGNPELTLQRGRTYRFKVNTSPGHPFSILGSPSGTVTNNGINTGTLTFAVPNRAGEYEYKCVPHDFGNKILVP